MVQCSYKFYYQVLRLCILTKGLAKGIEVVEV